jgi:peptidoglycan/LPS O-acetylase OafA/YrhL
LVVGSLVCILLSGRAGRPLTALLGIALALTLAYHVVSWRKHDGDHWFYFAYLTVDLIVLFVIGVLVAPTPPRREIHRA